MRYLILMLIIWFASGASSEPNYLRFETTFTQDTDWCGDGSVVIAEGVYDSAGYENLNSPSPTLSYAISAFPDVAGFSACYEYGGTYHGIVDGNPAEVQIAASGNSFAVYIYYLD